MYNIDQVQGQDGRILAKFCFSVFVDRDEVGFFFQNVFLKLVNIFQSFFVFILVDAFGFLVLS